MATEVNSSTGKSSNVGSLSERPWFSWRATLVQLHRWIGVIVSLYFCAMSVTGVSLVFHDELEDLLVRTPTIASTGPQASLSKIGKAVSLKYEPQKVSGIIFPLVSDKPVTVWIQDKEGANTPVLVNPFTAEILGTAQENSVLKFIQEAHFNLLAKTTGRKINSFGGLILVFLSLSGIILFCRSFAYCVHTMQMKWKGSARVISWSNHQKLGVLMLPMLLVWGISAYSFGFHKEFQSALNLILPITALQHSSRAGTVENTDSGGAASNLPVVANVVADKWDMLDAEVAMAKAQCIGQELSRIALPNKKEKLLKIWLTKSASNNKVDATEVDINAKNGQTVAVVRPELRTAGDNVLVWLPRVHFGNFAGIYSKIIWCVIGFTPLILSVTGLVMWWSPTRKKRTAQQMENIAKQMSAQSKRQP